MKMGKKNSYDLIESSSYRLVGLHYHRFGRFLRYLKEHKAEIHINVCNKKTGRSRTVKYITAPQKDRQNLEDLLIQALNITETQAREYSSRKLGLDDKHYVGDRNPDIGSVIHAIEYYFNSDTPIGEVSIFEKESNPFSIRSFDINALIRSRGHESLEFKELHKEFNNISNLVSSNFLTDLITKHFSDEFINVQSDDLKSQLFYGGNPSLYLFEDELNQLSNLYFPFLDESSESDIGHFEKVYEKLTKIYIDQLNSLNSALIIPGYIDFRTPYAGFNMFTRIMISEIFNHELDNNIQMKAKLIDYRFEVIKYFKTSNTKFSDWPTEIHALILLTYQENNAMRNAIWNAVTHLLKDIRFIVFTSKEGKVLNFQKDSLTIDELSELLTKFRFQKNVYDCFTIDRHIILNQELYRYPDHHAAKNSIDKKDISSALIQKLRSYLSDRYLIGMGMV